MPASPVVPPVKLKGWPLLVAVAFLAACSTQATVRPSATHAAASATPSVSIVPSTPGNAPVVTLSAIQRLNSRVGYIAAWNGTGVRLVKTSDGGTTWQRLPVPADYLASLRFIDERVGWAGGAVTRDAPRKGVVLRTPDGGQTWQT